MNRDEAAFASRAADAKKRHGSVPFLTSSCLHSGCRCHKFLPNYFRGSKCAECFHDVSFHLNVEKATVSEVQFLDAADSGDLVKLGDQIAAGVDVNTRNGSGDTALMVACLKGHISIVQYLVNFVKGRLAVDAQNQNGWTALMIAAAGGHLPIVHYLARYAQAAINTQRSNGYTALIEAAQYGHLAVIQYLVSLGAAGVSEVLRMKSFGATQAQIAEAVRKGRANDPSSQSIDSAEGTEEKSSGPGWPDEPACNSNSNSSSTDTLAPPHEARHNSQEDAEPAGEGAPENKVSEGSMGNGMAALLSGDSLQPGLVRSLIAADANPLHRDAPGAQDLKHTHTNGTSKHTPESVTITTPSLDAVPEFEAPAIPSPSAARFAAQNYASESATPSPTVAALLSPRVHRGADLFSSRVQHLSTRTATRPAAVSESSPRAPVVPRFHSKAYAGLVASNPVPTVAPASDQPTTALGTETDHSVDTVVVSDPLPSHQVVHDLTIVKPLETMVTSTPLEPDAGTTLAPSSPMSPSSPSAVERASNLFADHAALFARGSRRSHDTPDAPAVRVVHSKAYQLRQSLAEATAAASAPIESPALSAPPSQPPAVVSAGGAAITTTTPTLLTTSLPTSPRTRLRLERDVSHRQHRTAPGQDDALFVTPASQLGKVADLDSTAPPLYPTPGLRSPPLSPLSSPRSLRGSAAADVTPNESYPGTITTSHNATSSDAPLLPPTTLTASGSSGSLLTSTEAANGTGTAPRVGTFGTPANTPAPFANNALNTVLEDVGDGDEREDQPEEEDEEVWGEPL